MIRFLVRAIPLALLLGACAHAPLVPTPYAADRCPLPAGAMGYTVVARAADPSLADQAYLRGVVRAVVKHWNPVGEPYRRDRREERPDDLPDPEVGPPLFGRGDWRPQPGQRLEVAVAIRRDGTWSAPRLLDAGGDPEFARHALDAVRTTFTRPNPIRLGRDSVARTLPAAARAAGADSVVVRLLFGERARDGEEAVARFVVQERPITPVAHPTPAYPPEMLQLSIEGDALIQFVVDSTGSVDAGTMRILRSSDRAFAREAMLVLRHYRFRPAMADCTPVPQLAQMPFSFRIQDARAGR